MSHAIEKNGKRIPVRCSRTNGRVDVSLGSDAASLEVLQTGATSSFLHEGRQIEVTVLRRRDDGADVLVNGRFHSLSFIDEKRSLGSGSSLAAQGEVRAVMPGRVVKVHVAVGTAVAAGTPLLVLEAMKMENEIKSPVDGVVEKIWIAPGATVETGATMVSIGASRG